MVDIMGNLPEKRNVRGKGTLKSKVSLKLKLCRLAKAVRELKAEIPEVSAKGMLPVASTRFSHDIVRSMDCSDIQGDEIMGLDLDVQISSCTCKGLTSIIRVSEDCSLALSNAVYTHFEVSQSSINLRSSLTKCFVRDSLRLWNFGRVALCLQWIGQLR